MKRLLVWVLLVIPFSSSYAIFTPKQNGRITWVKHPHVRYICKTQNASNAHFLAAFPRSGQNFFHYFIQGVSERPICAFNGMIHSLPHMTHDLKKSPFYVMHNLYQIWKVPSKTNKYIALVRNYKECFIREMKAQKLSYTNPSQLLDLKINSHTFLEIYLGILKLYDRWKPENRLLVYYEDVVKSPEMVAKKLAKFLNEPESNAETFIKQYDEICQCAIRYYNTIQKKEGGSMTKGKSLIHHSESLCQKELVEFDELMRTHCGDIFDKYLNHYAENQDS